MRRPQVPNIETSENEPSCCDTTRPHNEHFKATGDVDGFEVTVVGAVWEDAFVCAFCARSIGHSRQCRQVDQSILGWLKQILDVTVIAMKREEHRMS